MASGSHSPVGRSGGKILKSRRTAARKTPYDRPNSPQPQPALLQSESPSWLSGLVSPAKFVAGGATKILTSIWNPKSWGTPSSSSSDSDSESEGDSGDDENPSDGQQKGSSSQKIETLHLIEQLLLVEQFSREECDRLIEIINSRAVDCSTRNDTDAGPSMIHNSINNETNDIRNEAIMEAKKWVAENKFRSGLKSDLDNGNYAQKSVMTPQLNEGSPIDVAKSYMKARPAWASPIDYDTQSPSDLNKERTPISISSSAGISFSSAKKDYLSGGSWNIQEEIRRVRTKATEDMLNSHRSLKHSLIYETPKSVDADEMNRNEKKESKKEEDKRNSDTVRNCYLMTESQEIMENSQDGYDQSLDTKEVSTPVTRSTRRGRGRGKGK